MAVNLDSRALEPDLILSAEKDILWVSDSEHERRVDCFFESFFSLLSDYLEGR